MLGRFGKKMRGLLQKEINLEKRVAEARAEREPGSNGGGQGPSPARLDRTRHRAVSSLDVRARSAPAAHGDVSGATLVAGHEGSCLDRLVTVAVRCLAAACPVPVRWLPGLGRPRAGGCAGRT